MAGINVDKADHIFSLEFMVRDYECDLQGIVNNACYQHYFEHTRHQFIKKYRIIFSLTSYNNNP